MLQLQTASLLQEAAPRSHPYSTFLVKRDSNGTSPNTRHKKPTHTAKAWEAHSCFAEQADHSCFFAGDRRAQKLGLHAAQLMLEFDAGRFLDALAGQKLTLYGDSLTRNHWVSLVCHLKEHMMSSKLAWVWSPAFSSCVWLDGRHCIMDTRHESCAFFRANTSICYSPNTFFFHADNKSAPPKSMGHVAVVNFGVHVYEESRYRSMVLRAVEFMRRQSHTRVIYREDLPQHFDTHDGGFDFLRHESNSTRGCQPLSAAAAQRQRWRLNFTLPLIQSIGVEVLPAWEAFVPAWDAHIDVGWRSKSFRFPWVRDCTHYCAPGKIDMLSKRLYHLLAPRGREEVIRGK